MKRIKLFTLLFVMLFASANINAQSDATIDEILGHNLEYNVISTAVPFMSIAPDARSSAMGDIGVSTSPDVYSMHWNPAKYAFIQDDFTVGLAYSPWLRNLVNDMNIAYLAMAKRIDSKSTIGATLRYFTLGDINYRDGQNVDQGTYSPNEWAVDVAYSRKLGKYISGSVAGRFIYSNLTQGYDTYAKAAISVAADISVYYTRDVYWFDGMDANFSWGAAITNIGSKMNYDESTLDKDFIPTNLRFGPTLKLDIDDYNSFAFSIDFNKLLVPTPPVYLKDTVTGSIVYADGKPVIAAGRDNEVGLVQGMIQSFYDAPGGLSEEFQEMQLSVGAEYWYDKVFAVRGGYFFEHENKGGRQYLTLGGTIKYQSLVLDVSYLIPTTTLQTSPLANTVRISLAMNFGGKKK